MLTHRDAFPTTDWGLLKNLRGNSPALREAGLNLLAGRYWRPVYGFLRRSGHGDAEAKDLTPDKVFDRRWAVGMVMRALTRLEAECDTTGKSAHYDIFVQRIIAPILHGAEEKSLADLGAQHGLTEKQAGNCLLTAKRAYRRLMEDEVRLYAETEADVADEIRELFLVLGQ